MVGWSECFRLEREFAGPDFHRENSAPWQGAPNNGSERALRPAVSFRKVTYCFRSDWGAELHADIRSVVETGRHRALDALEAIPLTLAGKTLAVASPAPS
jgi:hypothetical protein